MQMEKHNVSYDYDKYNNKIRRYTVTGHYKDGKRKKPIWTQDDSFKPEKGSLMKDSPNIKYTYVFK